MSARGSPEVPCGSAALGGVETREATASGDPETNTKPDPAVPAAPDESAHPPAADHRSETETDPSPRCISSAVDVRELGDSHSELEKIMTVDPVELTPPTDAQQAQAQLKGLSCWHQWVKVHQAFWAWHLIVVTISLLSVAVLLYITAEIVNKYDAMKETSMYIPRGKGKGLQGNQDLNRFAMEFKLGWIYSLVGIQHLGMAVNYLGLWRATTIQVKPDRFTKCKEWIQSLRIPLMGLGELLEIYLQYRFVETMEDAMYFTPAGWLSDPVTSETIRSYQIVIIVGLVLNCYCVVPLFAVERWDRHILISLCECLFDLVFIWATAKLDLMRIQIFSTMEAAVAVLPATMILFRTLGATRALYERVRVFGFGKRKGSVSVIGTFHLKLKRRRTSSKVVPTPSPKALAPQATQSLRDIDVATASGPPPPPPPFPQEPISENGKKDVWNRNSPRFSLRKKRALAMIGPCIAALHFFAGTYMAVGYAFAEIPRFSVQPDERPMLIEHTDCVSELRAEYGVSDEVELTSEQMEECDGFEALSHDDESTSNTTAEEMVVSAMTQAGGNVDGKGGKGPGGLGAGSSVDRKCVIDYIYKTTGKTIRESNIAEKKVAFAFCATQGGE